MTLKLTDCTLAGYLLVANQVATMDQGRLTHFGPARDFFDTSHQQSPRPGAVFNLPAGTKAL